MVERSKEKELTSPLPLLKGEGVGCFPLRGGGDSSLSYKGRVHPEDSPRGDREGLVKKLQIASSRQVGTRNDCKIRPCHSEETKATKNLKQILRFAQDDKKRRSKNGVDG